MVSSKGRGGGDPDRPWTHIQNRLGVFLQDDFKVWRQPDAEPGPALGLHVAARREGQPPDELRSVDRPADLRRGWQHEDRALYQPYYKGFEPRLGAAWPLSDRLVLRGGYGISQFMEGTGANLRLPLNPPFFFESAVTYDRTTGAGNAASGFAGLVPGTTPIGNVRAYDPNLRPQFSQQWNTFVEYQLTSSMSAQVGYVGHHADHLVTPVEGNQALPGVGDPADVGRQEHAPAALRRASRSSRPWPRPRRAAAAGTTRCRPACGSAVSTASNCWRRTRSAKHTHQQPRLLRRVRRHRTSGRDERHRRCLLAEHLRPRGGMGSGVSRRASQPGGLGHVAAAVRKRTPHWIRLERVDGCVARRLAAWRHLPGPHRTADHRDRRARPIAAG